MKVTLVTLGSLVLGLVLATADTGVVAQGAMPSPDRWSPEAHLQRALVAVPDAEGPVGEVALAALATRLHVADPKATPLVMLPEEPVRTTGPFEVAVEPRAATGEAARVRIGVGRMADLVVPLPRRTSDPLSPPWVTVIEVLGGAGGIVAHRSGRLDLTPGELRMPEWRQPGDGRDAVALEGAWWTLGPTGRTATAPAAVEPAAGAAPADAVGRLRTRLTHEPVSGMRRLVDVAVGDVTGDGTPDIALSFRRPFERTLLNAPLPRRAWTDGDGLSAHVGLYRTTDLSEIWVAGTLLRPVRRLAACTGALAVAYSTLRGSKVMATSAWRWQGFAFLPLPELSGRGTPTCIDIDRDGRSEAAIIERS